MVDNCMSVVALKYALSALDSSKRDGFVSRKMLSFDKKNRMSAILQCNGW